MIADVRDLLRAQPFVPFTIYTADGREYRVPTRDHAHILRGRVRLVVLTDESEYILPALLISGIGLDGDVPEL